MNAKEIQDQLMDWTVANSGAETRNYLGMSRISECSLVLYREIVNGGQRDWSLEMHLNCYNGYLFEHDMKNRLAAVGLYKPGGEREVVSDFDRRFRGHIDGEVYDGRLLEIKSTVQDNLIHIVQIGRIPRRHFSQVQVYMRHGGYSEAIVVYVARDTGFVHVAEIQQVRAVQDKLDEKAARILAAIDLNLNPPRCECGKC